MVKAIPQIYGLDVMVIPTNRPVRRLDLNDQVYKPNAKNLKQLSMRSKRSSTPATRPRRNRCC